MWYREVFLARTSPLPEAEMASMASVPVCGERWRESFATWEPATRTWRTLQRSLLAGFTEYSQTWPSSGSMRNRVCWEHPTLERPTTANESGFLPTPVAVDSGSRFNRSPSAGAAVRPTLGAMARFSLWPTPTAGDGRSSGSRNTTGSNSLWDQPDGCSPGRSRAGTEVPNPNSGDAQGVLGGSADSQGRPESRGRPAGLHDRGDRAGWPPEPTLGRVAHGVAHRVDRITALGNGQVPRVMQFCC